MTRRRRIEALPHQHAGSEFIASRSASALFDEQGLGKTKQVIDAVATDIDRGSLEGALVICPNTLKTTWGREIELHSMLPYAIFGAGKAARRLAFSSLGAAFYVINYEAVVREVTSLRALLRFKRLALVLDEGHRIKTPDAKITRAINRLQALATKRVLMTGTPVANTPRDLWSQIFFLDDGATLGATFDEFQRRFCGAGGGYVRLDELRQRLASISLRRLKADAVTLPEKTIRTVSVQLSGRQAVLYERMREDLYLWVRSMTGDQVLQDADNILVRLLRLAQLASHPRLLDASYDEVPAKVTALDALLRAHLAADPTQKVIVWTSFVGNIRMLAKRYAPYRPVCFFGEMDYEAREHSLSSFLSDPDVRLFIGNPAACREGLTLTVASTAVYLDRTFNLVDYLQSQDRIHRISQTQACMIYLLVAENTVDELIEFSLAQKLRLAQYVQLDSCALDPRDAALTKPDIVRALVAHAT